MNFTEWMKKNYPNEDEATRLKMLNSWVAGNVQMLFKYLNSKEFAGEQSIEIKGHDELRHVCPNCSAECIMKANIAKEDENVNDK